MRRFTDDTERKTNPAGLITSNLKGFLLVNLIRSLGSEDDGTKIE